MDRVAAIAVILAMPFLCAAFWGLTRWVEPLIGYGLALCLYWFGVLVPLILWRTDRDRLRAGARIRWPGTVWGGLGVVAVLGTCGALVLSGLPAAPVAAVAFLAALINGTLEEVFWRGTLLPEPEPPVRAAVLSLGLFILWHVALLFADGVAITGGAAGLMGGAAALGLIFLAMRLQTGTYGAAAVTHVAVNAAAFLELAARNT